MENPTNLNEVLDKMEVVLSQYVNDVERLLRDLHFHSPCLPLPENLYTLAIILRESESYAQDTLYQLDEVRK